MTNTFKHEEGAKKPGSPPTFSKIEVHFLNFAEFLGTLYNLSNNDLSHPPPQKKIMCTCPIWLIQTLDKSYWVFHHPRVRVHIIKYTTAFKILQYISLIIIICQNIPFS